MRLRQLLMVLLDNAMRYSRAGGEVSLSMAQTAADHQGHSNLILTVVDHGIGIPADELPRVFDRHFRGADARRHSPDGSGLGLSIARLLAQAHGGNLDLTSAEGHGTRATLTLPMLDTASLNASET